MRKLLFAVIMLFGVYSAFSETILNITLPLVGNEMYCENVPNKGIENSGENPSIGLKTPRFCSRIQEKIEQKIRRGVEFSKPVTAMPSLPAGLPWTGSNCNGTNIIMQNGIGALTCGVTTATAAADRWAFAYMNFDDIIPASGRSEETSSAEAYHHPSWHVDSIGNVFGVTMNTKTGEVLITASTNYGSGFLGNSSVIRFGAIAGGTASGSNDSAAGGAVYKIDATTGQATVFSMLPQQSTTISNIDCEYGTTNNRTNSGAGLGNIVFDEAHDQFFVSNIEDGRIYRLSSAGVILDSYDPFANDNGSAGVSDLEELVYGLAREPGTDRLFFGGVDYAPGSNEYAAPGSPGIYSITLNSNGSFPGTINNTNMPSGATYDNYEQTSETLHTTIATGSGFSYSQDYVYLVSDLAFSKNGTLLAGTRASCEGSFFSSYNHWSETNIITKTSGTNIYDASVEQLDITYQGLAAPEDTYGGVATYVDGSGNDIMAVSASDILTEAGPHGIAVFDDPPNSGSITPLAAISYGLAGNDPKGVGGDIDIWTSCVCVNPVITATDTDGCSGETLPQMTADISGGTWTVSSSIGTTVDGSGNVTLGTNSGGTNIIDSVFYTTSCSDTVLVTIFPSPSVTVSNGTTCEGIATTISATASGGDGNYTYAWSVPATASNPGDVASFLTLVNGTYTVTVTDGNSCEDSGSGTLTVNTAPTGGITVNNETCPELNNGSANGGASGGSGGYTWLWSTGATTQGISNLTSGSYSLTVTDSNGCKDTVSTTITEPDTLKVTIVSGNETCDGDNGSASASGSGGSPGYNYMWSSGETIDNISGKPAGTYIVTVTDANGCTVIDSVIIINIGLPNTGSVLYTGCEGDGYFVMVEGNRYDEFNRTGTETVSGGNQSGCDSVITINLTYNLPPVLTANDTTICTGSLVDLAGLFFAPGATVTYHSALPPTVGNTLASTVVSPSTQADYYALAVNGLGCSDTLDVTVTPDSPDASFNFVTETSGVANDTVVCHGGVINFGAAIAFGSGTGSQTYQWTANPADSVVFTGSADGLFESGTFSNRGSSPLTVNMKFVVTDSLGCQDSINFDAIVQPLLGIDSIQHFENSGTLGDQGVCFGDSISFKVHTSPSGSYTYTWDNGAGIGDSVRVAPPYNNLNTVYNVTVADAFGCTASAFTSAKGFPDITANVSFKQGCSVTDQDTLIYTVTGGIPSAGGYIFTIDSLPLPLNSFSPFKVPIKEPEGALITTVIDDQKGCGPTLQITVPVLNYLDLTVSSTDETCQDGSGTATATPIGGMGTYSYLWSNGASSPTISGLSAGTYIVTVTDTVNCSVIDSVTVMNTGLPNTGSETYTGCSGDGYSVTVNAVVYDESNPTGTETLTNAAGCDSVVMVNLVFNSLPEISTRDSSVCLNTSLDLPLLVEEDNGVAGTITYHPTLIDANANTNSIGGTIVLNDTTTYYVRKTSAAGCFDIDSILVSPNEFDLALKKVLLTSGTIQPDDIVLFEIKVYNQGLCEASQVIVYDYIPVDFILADSDWDNSVNVQTAVDTIPVLAAGDSVTLQISLQVAGNANGIYINNAEIVSAQGGTDADSPLTILNDGSTNEMATDNDIDDNGVNTPGTVDNSSDEDDYDPAQVIVECPDPSCLPVSIEKINE